jgi:TonB family protein
MILTMAYLLLIASLLGLGAHFGERICTILELPRRTVWLAALASSLVLPALMFLADAAPTTAATPVLSLPPVWDQIPVIRSEVQSMAAGGPDTPSASFNWPEWRVFEAGLIMLWTASSVAVLLLYSLAGLRMRGIMREAEFATIDGQAVLLSERLGPAVVGFFKPRIVVPRWLAQNDSVLRSQVLLHEREHLAAHDQLSLLAALLLIACMPWNIALWWQLRRLRAAIEFDCDRRVLRAGADPHSYSVAILTVGRRAPRIPFAAVALTEPMSQLELRIRTMLEKARGSSLVAIGVRAAIVASVLTVAFAVNAPKAQQPSERPLGPTDTRLITPEPMDLRAAVQVRLAEARACMEQRDPPGLVCARRLLDEARAVPDLNTFESLYLLSFDAQLSRAEGDTGRAITAYERIVDLPDEQVSGEAGYLVAIHMRDLASLYVEQYRYSEALALYDRWLAQPSTKPSAEDIYLRAQMLYMLGQFGAATTETERAIAALDNAPAHWYEQLYALQRTAGDRAGAARTLEILTTRWPDSERISLDLPGKLDLQRIGFSEAGNDFEPVTKPDPIYPARALQRGYEGHVIVSYTVTAAGETADVMVVESSSPLFDRAAVEAVQRYQYEPRRVDGKPVEVVRVRSRIDFELPDDD